MPIALYSFRKTSSGRIMFHGFLAGNAADAAKDLEAHAAACPQFGPAHREGKTIEVEIEVDTLPEFDEESIEEFLELEGDDEEDEEELEAESDEEEEDDEK